MSQFLTYGFFIAIAGVFIVLVFGLINLVRSDPEQASRSQKLMRMRILVQFIAIMFLVALGFVTGAIRLPF